MTKSGNDEARNKNPNLNDETDEDRTLRIFDFVIDSSLDIRASSFCLICAKEEIQRAKTDNDTSGRGD